MADRGVAVSRPHLSIVVPSYNESAHLREKLPQVFEWLAAQPIRGEIVIADDGSSDDTETALRRLLQGKPARIVRSVENRGKGHAVRHGFAAATGRWVLFSDADFSTPIEQYTRLADHARDHDLDIVIGSRDLPDSDVRKRQHVARETMGKSFNRLVRLLTGLRFADTQCGFKLVHRARVAPLFELMRIDGFAWDVELLYLAVRFRLGVAEVPVTWVNDERSTVSVLRDPPRMLLDVLRVRWGFRVGAYDPSATAGGRQAP